MKIKYCGLELQKWTKSEERAPVSWQNIYSFQHHKSKLFQANYNNVRDLKIP